MGSNGQHGAASLQFGQSYRFVEEPDIQSEGLSIEIQDR